MRVRPGYFEFKRRYRQTVGRVKPLYNAIHAVKERVKDAVLPANIFDDMGFYYLGPVDGHDLPGLISALGWGAGDARAGAAARHNAEGARLRPGGAAPGLVPRRGAVRRGHGALKKSARPSPPYSAASSPPSPRRIRA